ncbi:50S ribosomal protein L18 [candidate division KSB1 bacterium]|nr:50S ribosomal protein L18 [candidate division KSB1 bacterium]
MSVKSIDKAKHRKQKKQHIRKSVIGTAERPRLAVFRSLKHMYAQLIDDSASKTILTVSSLSTDIASDVAKAKTKTEVAKLVGMQIAKQAKDMKLEHVVFDRAGYIYHGRVKAMADGAREGGLIF